MKRRGYYGDPAPTTVAQATEPRTLDLVRGAREIAELLGIENPKRVYHLIDVNSDAADPPPIRNIPGLGLAADRRTLLAWWARQFGVSA